MHIILPANANLSIFDIKHVKEECNVVLGIIFECTWQNIHIDWSWLYLNKYKYIVGDDLWSKSSHSLYFSHQHLQVCLALADLHSLVQLCWAMTSPLFKAFWLEFTEPLFLGRLSEIKQDIKNQNRVLYSVQHGCKA